MTVLGTMETAIDNLEKKFYSTVDIQNSEELKQILPV